MRVTSEWRTTSAPENCTTASSSMPDRRSIASRSPDGWRLGRSTWDGSPVTTIRLFSPNLVKNIFIWTGVVFCASSRMTKALDSVRPRMKASGATSTSPLDRHFMTCSAGSMSNSAS